MKNPPPTIGLDFGTPPWSERSPVARSTDPGTSWEAARSIKETQLRMSQSVILALLQKHGPMTDHEIYSHLAYTVSGEPVMSSSGARTRRAELVEMGKVEDTGETRKLPSGRRATVWGAVA